MDPGSPDSSQSGVQSTSAGKMFGALQYEQDIEESYPQTPAGQVRKFFDFWRSPTSFQKARLKWRAFKSNITWTRRRWQKRFWCVCNMLACCARNAHGTIPVAAFAGGSAWQ